MPVVAKRNEDESKKNSNQAKTEDKTLEKDGYEHSLISIEIMNA